MNAMTPALGLGRRALLVSALAGALFAALLAPHQARATYSGKVKSNKLVLVGDGDSDQLVLRLRAGDPTILEVDVGADGTADFSFNRSRFRAIDVQAKGGDDEVRIDQSNGAFPDELVTIDGGQGEDTLLGGSGEETLIGGAGNDFVDGNQGADTAFLGDGDDRFQWDPGDSNDVVEGQAGQDTLLFNGSNIAENMQVSANGERVRFTRNIASIVMDLDGVEAASVNLRGGADILTADDLTGTALVTVAADLSLGGTGDASADMIVVNGTDLPDVVDVSKVGSEVVTSGLHTQTRIFGSEPTLDTLLVQTLGGNDDVTVAPDVADLINTIVDLGGDE